MVFYAQSTGTVISGRRRRQTDTETETETKETGTERDTERHREREDRKTETERVGVDGGGGKREVTRWCLNAQHPVPHLSLLWAYGMQNNIYPFTKRVEKSAVNNTLYT